MRRFVWIPVFLGLVLLGAMMVRRPSGPGEGERPYRPRPAGQLTFNEHIAPILHARCAECHRPGQTAPFDLLSYEDARKRGRQIAEVTASRIMPPWMPHPGQFRFENERRLKSEEIGMIGQWVAEGMPAGDPARVARAPVWPDGWQLGAPDLVVEMPESFVVPPDGPDIYRNFVVPVPLGEPRHVVAVQFRPDNPRAIHHATLQIDETGSCRDLDARDPGVGFSGIMVAGRAHLPDGYFVGWAPGKAPYRVPDDMGWLLPPRSDLVLQLHLRPSGKAEPIRVSLGLYFATRPPARFPVSVVMRDKLIDIPAGEAGYPVRQAYTLPVGVQLLGIYPHAHYLGRSMRVTARLPGASDPLELVRIDDWNFNWQDEYRYREPIPLPAGTVVEMDYRFDNSASNVRNPHQPPRRVTYGRNATDEMAELLLQVLPRTREERDVLRQDVARNALEQEILRRRRGVELRPDDPREWRELGLMYRQLGRSEESIPAFRRLAELEPGSAEAHFLLGDALARSARTPEAVAALETAVKLDPEQPESLNSLARLLAAPGAGAARDPRRAIELAARAVAKSPRPDPGLLETLMIAQAEAGEMDKAMETGRAAMQLAEQMGVSDFAVAIRQRLEAYLSRAPAAR